MLLQLQLQEFKLKEKVTHYVQIKNKYPARHGDASLHSPSTRGSRDKEIEARL